MDFVLALSNYEKVFGLCRLNHLHHSEEADGLTSPYSQRLDSATQAAELSAESVCECEYVSECVCSTGPVLLKAPIDSVSK